MRLAAQVFGFCGILVGLLALVIVIGDERTPPSPDQLRQWFSPFVYQGRDLQGVYRGMDVDSVAFTYVTEVTDAVRFWEGVVDAATREGWTVVTLEGTLGEFDRPQSTQSAQHGPWHAERVRIRKSARHVSVGWIQVDDSKRIDDLTRALGFGHSKVVWAKLDDHLPTDRLAPASRVPTASVANAALTDLWNMTGKGYYLPRSGRPIDALLTLYELGPGATAATCVAIRQSLESDQFAELRRALLFKIGFVQDPAAVPLLADFAELLDYHDVMAFYGGWTRAKLRPGFLQSAPWAGSRDWCPTLHLLLEQLSNADESHDQHLRWPFDCCTGAPPPTSPANESLWSKFVYDALVHVPGV